MFASESFNTTLAFRIVSRTNYNCVVSKDTAKHFRENLHRCLCTQENAMITRHSRSCVKNVCLWKKIVSRAFYHWIMSIFAMLLKHVRMRHHREHRNVFFLPSGWIQFHPAVQRYILLRTCRRHLVPREHVHVARIRGSLKSEWKIFFLSTESFSRSPFFCRDFTHRQCVSYAHVWLRWILEESSSRTLHSCCAALRHSHSGKISFNRQNLLPMIKATINFLKG